MKRILLFASALLATVSMMGQQPISAQKMIGITPVVSQSLDLPADARASLEQKLLQMVTTNGFGSFSGRFALTANVVTVDKQVTATAPAQFVTELEVSLYVLDATEQTVLDEMSLTVKGIDRVEQKSTIKAINSINARSPQIRKFMTNVRETITDYYSTQVPTIIKKAETYAQMDNYDMALFILADIPESVDEYPMVADRMTDIYTMKINSEALALINKAETAIAKGDNNAALDYLSEVNPQSEYSGKASELTKSIMATSTQSTVEYENRKTYTNDASFNAAQKRGVIAAVEGWFSNRF